MLKSQYFAKLHCKDPTVNKTVQAALCTAIAVAAAAPVLAQTTPAYVGVSVGRADQELDASLFTASHDSTAAKLVAGYRVNDTFGIEIGYLHQRTAELALSGTILSAKPRSFYAAATVGIPLTPEFALFGKLGASANRVKLSNFGAGERSESSTTALAGVGLSYAFTPTLAAVVEYEHFGKVLDEGVTLKANLLSVGLRASF